MRCWELIYPSCFADLQALALKRAGHSRSDKYQKSIVRALLMYHLGLVSSDARVMGYIERAWYSLVLPGYIDA